MALFTANTFSEYSGQVEPVPGQWRGLTLGYCKEALSAFGGELDGTALGIYVKFLTLLEVADDTEILGFKFDQSCVLEMTSASPIIRKLEDSSGNFVYCIQINQKKEDAILLMSLKDKWGKDTLKAEILEIGSGDQKYQVPAWTITLPADKTDDEFAVATSFSLRIDAEKIDVNGESKPAYDQLVAAFSKSRVKAETLQWVAGFKEGTGATLLKNLQPGLYQIKSYESVQRESKEKGTRWTSILLTCVDGTKIDMTANSPLGKQLMNPWNKLKYDKVLASGECIEMFIDGFEEVAQGISVKGNIFAGKAPTGLVPGSGASFKQMKSAKANTLPAPALQSQPMTFASAPAPSIDMVMPTMKSAAVSATLPNFDEDEIPAL